MRRIWAPLVFGLVGVAILVSLGRWQLQRLEWKTAVLAEIEARIGADPVAVPANPDREADRYLPVAATGTAGPDELHVLVSVKNVGPGFRVITPFDVDGRRLLLDLGFVREAKKAAARDPGPFRVEGNLHWPDEIDRFTPEPDLVRNIWFAREVDAMAAALGTEPVLIVARATSEADPAVRPMPVDTSGIPNDHLEYAITWFSLAVVWAGMTGFLLWRIWRRTL